MEDLSVLITSESNAKVSYKKDTENNRVIIYGNAAIEVSYHLSSPRFDHASWTNLATGDATGYTVPDISLPGGAPIDLSTLSVDTNIVFGTSLDFLNSSSTSEFAFQIDSGSTPILKLVDNLGLSLLEITTSGSIGIGTSASSTRPITIKQGMGSAISDGWDVYSLEEYKTNIEYLEDKDTEDILEKIKNTPIARYNYKTDKDFNNDKHLGLIVEQAPIEIISKTKQGISLYDLATFTLAGVKELASKQDELEARVASLELRLDDGGSLTSTETDVGGLTPSALLGSGGTTPTTTDSSSFLASLKDALASLGATIENSILKVTQLVTSKLVIEQADPLTSSTSTLSYNTIGEGVILGGTTSTIVEAAIIGVYDKVFITSRTITDRTLNIVEQKAGDGFSVALKYPAEEDIHFDWWIVGVSITEPPVQNTNVSNTEPDVTTTEVSSPTTTDSGVIYPEISADYDDYLENVAPNGESANASSTNATSTNATP